MSVSPVTAYFPDPDKPGQLKLQTKLIYLQNDTSPEADRLKEGFKQLKAATESGTADPEALRQTREALHAALNAHDRQRVNLQADPTRLAATDAVAARRAAPPPPPSPQARADFRSLSGALAAYDPVAAEAATATRHLRARATGALVSGEA